MRYGSAPSSNAKQFMALMAQAATRATTDGTFGFGGTTPARGMIMDPTFCWAGSPGNEVEPKTYLWDRNH